MTRYYLILLAFFLTACSTKQNSSHLLEKPIDPAQFYCAGSSSLSHTQKLGSEALYSQMRSCLVQKRYSSAAVLFSLAGTLSWYQASNSQSDALRNKHTRLLKESLNGISKDQLHSFWSEVHKLLGALEPLNRLCTQFMSLGSQIEKETPPMGSVRWNSALKHYLHCPANLTR